MFLSGSTAGMNRTPDACLDAQREGCGRAPNGRDFRLSGLRSSRPGTFGVLIDEDAVPVWGSWGTLCMDLKPKGFRRCRGQAFRRASGASRASRGLLKWGRTGPTCSGGRLGAMLDLGPSVPVEIR